MSKAAPAPQQTSRIELGRLVPLYAAQALATGATTVSTILASIIMGTLGFGSLSGLPSTLISVSAALSAGFFGALMLRSGRRLGLGLAFALGTLGAVLGFGASLLAARVLRRGRTGDARRASFLMAAGTGLAASLAGDMGSVMPFVFGAGALFGTRMMYQALPEVAGAAAEAVARAHREEWARVVAALAGLHTDGHDGRLDLVRGRDDGGAGPGDERVSGPDLAPALADALLATLTTGADRT